VFGFSGADWIFIVLVLGVTFLCIAISDMRKKK
jgi:hypothetical protein